MNRKARGQKHAHSLLTATLGRFDPSDDRVALPFYRRDFCVELELETLLLQELLETLPAPPVSIADTSREKPELTQSHHQFQHHQCYPRTRRQ